MRSVRNLGNNYTELNDPIDLRKRFVDEKKREKAGFMEAHQTDYDYLEAIEHGFPPTCGIAIGIDRLVMLLTDAKSIKKSSRSQRFGPNNNPMITRSQAIDLLHEHTKNQNLRRHMYAVGFAMQALARNSTEI